MKKLTEKEVRSVIDSVRTGDDALAVVRSFATSQPQLTEYIDESSTQFSQAEKYFIISASSTIWNVLAVTGLDIPLITRDTIGKIVSDINTEISPLFAQSENDPLTSMQSIIDHSSQGELLLALIGIILSATEDKGEDRIREEILQSLFFRLIIVIEVLSRTGQELKAH